MKGLELSEEYYEMFGKPMIEAKFADYSDRIACGLVGEGSECFGYDDEISQDHDWGPGFCLWLNEEDFGKIGKQLKEEYENLPEEFKGYKRLTSNMGKNRVGVFEIGTFYKKFIGFSTLPKNYNDWLSIQEIALATCTNGKIFKDNLDEFSRIRNLLLSYYPDEIRKIKIASKCISAGQSGQYNFLRSLRRKDFYAVRFSEMKFCEELISIAFLINKIYQPFYKWAFRKLKELSLLGEYLYEGINYILKINDYEKKIPIIEELAVSIKEVLNEKKISNVENNFLVNHGLDIYNKIDNDELKKCIKL